jgi:hypothetical protein
MKKNPAKVQKVLHEYKAGKLHSGKIGKGKGPVVKSRKQAIAIALSEAGMSKAMDKGMKNAIKKMGKN